MYIDKLSKVTDIDSMVLKEMFEPPKEEKIEKKEIRKEIKFNGKITGRRDTVYKLEYETILIALRGRRYFEKLSSKNIENSFLRKIVALAEEYFNGETLDIDIIENDTFFEEEKKELVNIIYSAEMINDTDEYFKETAVS